jgi:hypothetical protein
MDQFQIGERIWGTDRPFFLKVAHCLSKCTIPSGQRIEGSLADALLREPHYLKPDSPDDSRPDVNIRAVWSSLQGRC